MATEVVNETRGKKDYRPASTVWKKNVSEMTVQERIVTRGTMAPQYHSLKAEEFDRGPVQQRSVLKEHLFILSHASPPFIIQTISQSYFGYNLPAYLAFPLYLVCFTIYAIKVIRHFEYFALIGGTLREKSIGRDRTPDQSISQLAKGFIFFLVGRTAGEFLLKFDATEVATSSFSWTFPARIFTWLIVLDYFFYSYHRLCHETDYFWSIHMQHHTTKNPSPVLSILADSYQEVLEVALIPLCATLIIPMSFHELYLAACYTTYVEILGHTGMRMIFQLPITGPILRLVGMELIVEDHDAHHHGGKGGMNYGKQSRVWDTIFGTTSPRKEHAHVAGLTPF